MKTKTVLTVAFFCEIVFISASPLFARAAYGRTAQKLAEQGFESDPKVLREVATGGTPMGRWKEGLTFEGVRRCRGSRVRRTGSQRPKRYSRRRSA